MANSLQKCPVCGVLIEDDAKVIFSYGKPGTRSRLYARVCQFAKDKANCINQDDSKIGDILETDYYD
jgi:hypothetical protein